MGELTYTELLIVAGLVWLLLTWALLFVERWRGRRQLAAKSSWYQDWVDEQSAEATKWKAEATRIEAKLLASERGHREYVRAVGHLTAHPTTVVIDPWRTAARNAEPIPLPALGDAAGIMDCGDGGRDAALGR